LTGRNGHLFPQREKISEIFVLAGAWGVEVFVRLCPSAEGRRVIVQAKNPAWRDVKDRRPVVQCGRQQVRLGNVLDLEWSAGRRRRVCLENSGWPSVRL
jgi:hypothetical protein